MTNTIDHVHDRYKPKINLLLQNIAEELVECGFTTEGPYLDVGTSEYFWTLFVDDMGEPWATVEITIMESRHGDGEVGRGVNFSLSIIASEGETILNVTPFNYSRKVWVDAEDESAVLDRWELFERSVRPEDVVDEIREFQALGA